MGIGPLHAVLTHLGIVIVDDLRLVDDRAAATLRCGVGELRDYAPLQRKGLQGKLEAMLAAVWAFRAADQDNDGTLDRSEWRRLLAEATSSESRSSPWARLAVLPARLSPKSASTRNLLLCRALHGCHRRGPL